MKNLQTVFLKTFKMFFSFFPFFVGKVATRILEQQDSHGTKLKKQQQNNTKKKHTQHENGDNAPWWKA